MIIHGYRINQKSRCDFCLRSVKSVYLVKDGECQGKYCSKEHYIMALDRANLIGDKDEKDPQV